MVCCCVLLLAVLATTFVCIVWLAMLPAYIHQHTSACIGAAPSRYIGGQKQARPTCISFQGVEPQTPLKALACSGLVTLEVGVPQSKLGKGTCLMGACHSCSCQPVSMSLPSCLLLAHMHRQISNCMMQTGCAAMQQKHGSVRQQQAENVPRMSSHKLTSTALDQQVTANVCMFLPSVCPKSMHKSFLCIDRTARHSTYAC